MLIIEGYAVGINGRGKPLTKYILQILKHIRMKSY